MSKKLKIFILPLVASGHVNPICGIVYELCQMTDVECIIYGVAEYKELMERTGAQFRFYAHRTFANLTFPSINDENKNELFAIISNTMVEAAYEIIPQILSDISRDKPDLVFYDSNFMVARHLVRAIRKRGSSMKIAEFYPNFVILPEIMKKHPNLFKLDVKLVLSLIGVYFRQLKLSWTLDFPGINLFKMSAAEIDTIKIVAVFPELHLDLDLYDSSYKFVGQCVAEEARECENTTTTTTTTMSDEDLEMKSILDRYAIKNTDVINKNEDFKLILMSLGTVFHNNIEIYEFLLQDICNYDQKQPARKFTSSQFQFIVSTGEASLNRLNEKIAQGKLILPSNVILRARVPQLEVLKRADLFITHNGQNSTSEAIKYAVPMVGIPIYGDQPVVAIRVCDELSLGVRLDLSQLKRDDIGDAIDKVLGDPKYKEKIIEFSKISARYNGRRDGAKLLVDYAGGNSEKKSTSLI